MHASLRSMSFLFLFFALGLPASVYADPPSKEDCVQAGLKDCKPLTAFVSKLRTAVKNNDKATVAGMIFYPIEVQGGDGTEIKNKEAFIKNYDKIMTSAVQEVLLEDPFVTPRQIIQFVNDKAQIWLDVDGNKLLVGTIIVE